MNENVTDGLGEGFGEFVRIVEEGSLSAAARAMGLPRPTLSRRLKKLEKRLGVRLVHLSTRRLVLTDAGEALFNRARRLVAETAEVEAAIRQLDGVPRGLLRVSLPPGVDADGKMSRLILNFLAKYPEVRLEATVTSAHVDMVSDGIDVALRGGEVTDESLVARRLFAGNSVLVAAPSYLERHGHPKSACELASHACICGYEKGTRPVTHWKTSSGERVRVKGPLVTNNITLRLNAVLGGAGIGMLPSVLVEPQLAEGTLVPLLPGVFEREGGVWLVYVDREYIQPKVRAFVEFLVERFSDRPYWDQPTA